jgi:hypothetical protein
MATRSRKGSSDPPLFDLAEVLEDVSPSVDAVEVLKYVPLDVDVAEVLDGVPPGQDAPQGSTALAVLLPGAADTSSGPMSLEELIERLSDAGPRIVAGYGRALAEAVVEYAKGVRASGDVPEDEALLQFARQAEALKAIAAAFTYAAGSTREELLGSLELLGTVQRTVTDPNNGDRYAVSDDYRTVETWDLGLLIDGLVGRYRAQWAASGGATMAAIAHDDPELAAGVGFEAGFAAGMRAAAQDHGTVSWKVTAVRASAEKIARTGDVSAAGTLAGARRARKVPSDMAKVVRTGGLL